MKATKKDLHESGRVLSQEEFINKIKTDDEFANKWGELGPIYGRQWRNWNARKKTYNKGFLHKVDNVWVVKWSDLHSFVNGIEWMCTTIQESDQKLYNEKDESRKVIFELKTLRYDEKSFYPIQVAEIVKNKYDEYIGGVNQIQNLINDLKTNPDSRRLMVNAWNCSELDQMVLPPCHYGFQVYTRELSDDERVSLYERKQYSLKTFIERDLIKMEDIPTRAISLMWNQRSVDTFLGLPFNIASYGLLLEIIAKQVNMVPEELIGNLGDVHLYSNHIEQAKEQIGRDLTDEERYNIWFNNNYETGMERYFDPNNLPDYDNDYYEPTPKRTREPFPLPKLVFNPIFLANLEHKSFDEAINGQINFQIEDYQSHPTIKAPLSN